jgi:hypothetical protein
MNNQELDMQLHPEHYKEYIDEPEVGIEPDYPFHDGYMIVDHRSMPDMGGDKPCFHDVDNAVMWAEVNLGHNDYNVYQIKVVL